MTRETEEKIFQLLGHIEKQVLEMTGAIQHVNNNHKALLEGGIGLAERITALEEWVAQFSGENIDRKN